MWYKLKPHSELDRNSLQFKALLILFSLFLLGENFLFLCFVYDKQSLGLCAFCGGISKMGDTEEKVFALE